MNDRGLQVFLSLVPGAPISHGVFEHGFYMDGELLRYRHSVWDVLKPKPFGVEFIYLVAFMDLSLFAYWIGNLNAVYQNICNATTELIAATITICAFFIFYTALRTLFMLASIWTKTIYPAIGFDLAKRMVLINEHEDFYIKFSEPFKLSIILDAGYYCDVYYPFLLNLSCSAVACSNAKGDLCYLAEFCGDLSRRDEFSWVICRLMGVEAPISTYFKGIISAEKALHIKRRFLHNYEYRDK